jgi:hypothetical protein
MWQNSFSFDISTGHFIVAGFFLLRPRRQPKLELRQEIVLLRAR